MSWFERSGQYVCCLSIQKTSLRAPIKCLNWLSQQHRQINQMSLHPKVPSCPAHNVWLKLSKGYRKTFESGLTTCSSLSGNAKALRIDLNWGKDQGKIGPRKWHFSWTLESWLEILHIFSWQKRLESEIYSDNSYIWNTCTVLLYILQISRK